MFEFSIRIPCRRPRAVAESLRPDLKRDAHSTVSVKAGRGVVEIRVRSSKAGHMKAIVNTYMSLVQTLEKVDRSV